MHKVTFLIFFSLFFSVSFSQRRIREISTQESLTKSSSLIQFYRKIRDIEQFTNFTLENSPSIAIGSSIFTTIQDSSSSAKSSSPTRDVYHIIKFVGHPFFSDSIKGRLEIFTSTSWDGFGIWEVSSKLYFDFENEETARAFLCNLIDSLQLLSEKQWYTNDRIERYEFASDLRPDRYEPGVMWYRQYVVLEFSRSKSGSGCQIYIGDHASK